MGGAGLTHAEKIKFYDRENALKAEQIVEKARLASGMEKELHAELAELEERLGGALGQAQAKDARILELERRVALKERKAKEVKKEIERMGGRVAGLQSSQQAKDEENIQKFRKFEAQMKDMLADKRRSADRTRQLAKAADDLHARLAEKDAELAGRAKQHARETRALKEENHKLHQLLEQLSVENQSVSALKTKATQLDAYVLSLTQQFERERRRFEDLARDKDLLDAQLGALQRQYRAHGESALDALKAVMAELERELEQARHLAEQQRAELARKDARLLELDTARKQHCAAVASALGQVAVWAESYIGKSNFYEEASPPRAGGALGDYAASVGSLEQAVGAARESAGKRFRELRDELERLKRELWETTGLKDEIVEDLRAFRASIGQQEALSGEMKLEKERLEARLAAAREESARQRQMREEAEQANSALLTDFFRALDAVREKFESVDYVERQLDLRLGARAQDSRTAALSEVIALVGDITNLQSFEIKSLQVRLAELEEGKAGWDQARAEMCEQVEQLQAMKQQEVAKLEEAYHAKHAHFASVSEDLERAVKELTDQAEQLNVKLLRARQENSLLSQQADEAHEAACRARSGQATALKITLGLLYRGEALVEQKRCLAGLLEAAEQRERDQRAHLRGFFERYQIEATPSPPAKPARVQRALKFRRAVVAVLAALRIKRARFLGRSVRAISENLQELRAENSENRDSSNHDLRPASGPAPHTALGLRNLFQRVNLLSLPGDTRVGFSSKGEGLEQLESRWSSLADFVADLRVEEAELGGEERSGGSAFHRQPLLSFLTQSLLATVQHERPTPQSTFALELGQVERFLGKIDRQSQEIFKT